MLTPTLIGFARCTTGAGVITTDNAYNCSVARTADGDYNVTIGQGGVDATACIASVVPDNAAVSQSCTHTSDTVKRIRFSDAAGALVLPGGFNVAFWRMPPV